ncbi:hypothetical protein H7171_03750 [Candidatus Saccharibacteria bacterium]|nr:hypothetical protein [Candidatus Saccharibacteria bacterium]
MKFYIEALRSVVNRSFMVGGDLGKVALLSTRCVGRVACNVVAGSAELAIGITDSKTDSKPVADEYMVTSPEAETTSSPDVDTAPRADANRITAQAVALGPMVMFLSVNQKPDGENR